MSAANFSTPLHIPQVLVYTATEGYRHDSIPVAKVVLAAQSQTYGVNFTFSEDRTLFRDEQLGRFDNIMFVSNTEDVLDADGKAAFQKWLSLGGTYVGVHSASGCLQDQEFYQKEVGAIFDYHPEISNATFIPLNTTHPSMLTIPDRWNFEEEVYNFKSDPRSVGAEVLMTVDKDSYNDLGSQYDMGSPHPIGEPFEPPPPPKTK